RLHHRQLTERPKGHTLYDKLRGATKDPMQQAVRDALIAFMAATSQKARAESTKPAQRAGIEQAKDHKDRAYLGRKPSFTRAQLAKLRDLLGQQKRPGRRGKEDPTSAEAALAA